MILGSGLKTVSLNKFQTRVLEPNAARLVGIVLGTLLVVPAIRERLMPAVSARAPLLVAAVVIVAVNFVLVAARVSHPMPNNPWEAGLVVDGWRMSRGLTVYEEPRAGHATTMYGPLVTATLAAVFKVTGANNYAGRVFETLCGLSAVTLLALALLHGQPKTTLFIGWAILLSVNVRSGNYFTDTRPDMACFLFCVLAFVLAYRDGWVSFAASLAALVVAFYFKQTAVVAAVAISLAFVLRRVRVRLWWLKSLLSFALLPCAVLVTRALFPIVFHYMITVPSVNMIPPERVLYVTLGFLPTVPFFFVALVEFLSSCERAGAKGAWLAAAVPPAFVYSIISAARLGGVINSLLPAVAAMLAFAVWRLPRLLTLSESTRLGAARRFAFGVALAFAVLATALASFEESWFYTWVTHGDAHYAEVIGIARALLGKVVCPNDPTIPLYAKGYAGRQALMERDAVSSPQFMPDYAFDEVASADYVIQLDKPFAGQVVPDSRLEQLGLRPVERAELKGSAYTLWAAKR